MSRTVQTILQEFQQVDAQYVKDFNDYAKEKGQDNVPTEARVLFLESRLHLCASALSQLANAILNGDIHD